MGSLIVRPITLEEEERWDALVRTNHYLGFNGLIGERLKYVAILEGHWVGLLGWAAAALKCADRDQWIGWKIFKSVKGLKYIANNWRFLILPEIKIKNLASSILSLNLRRLSQDWIDKYTHPIFLVETFVDESLFRGTCYKANNWILIGRSAGFQKGHSSYSYHGNKKLIFIKPLIKDAKMRLKGHEGEAAIVDIEEIPIFGDDGLLHLVRNQIEDHRSKHGMRFRIDGFLVLCILAIMSGATGYTDIHRWIKNVPAWFIDRLNIRKAPSISQIRRFIMNFETDRIEKILTEWLLEHVDLAGKQICFDGKTVRGSKNNDKRAIQLVSATTADRGIVISQMKVPEGSHEIPVVHQMINVLPLGASTISVDAAHTQIATVIAVAARAEGGIFTIKGNQKNLKVKVEEALKTRAFSP